MESRIHDIHDISDLGEGGCGNALTVSSSGDIEEERRRTNPGTEAEPQQIVAQRLLSCLQYPVP